MPELTERERIGARLYLARWAARALKVVSLLFILAWFGSSYSGTRSILGFWEWLTTSANFKDFEPLVALAAFTISLLLDFITRSSEQLRADLPETAHNREDSRELKEWQTVRSALIKTVHNHWIDGYLSGSLVRRVRIRLGAEKAPDAISHPINFEIVEGNKPKKLTENGLLRIFDESGGCLLILGEPGSGKTFTLVQLAEQLLKRAKGNPDAPVPVIVPLTSWATDQQPIEVWLTSELQHHYGLSKKTTPTVLKLEKGLTILLDGLDEVREDVRSACLEKIQAFAEDFLGYIVVCSRTNEYFALDSRLSRGQSIRLLPLSEDQVEKYINDIHAGTRLDGLRLLLDEDANFKKLASTPLMLNLMALVHSSEPDTLKTDAAAPDAGESIFRQYVQQMFLRKKNARDTNKATGEKVTIAKGHAVHWLQQIAKQMAKHETTAFYIEHIQPTWTSSRWMYPLIVWLIFGLSVGLIGGLIVGLSRGLSGGLIFGLIFGLSVGLIGGLIVGLTIGLTIGLIFGLSSSQSSINLIETIRLKFDVRRLIVGLAQGLIGVLIFGLVFGLAQGLSEGLIDQRSHPQPARPNQHFHKSIQLSLVTAGVLGLTAAVIEWLFQPEMRGLYVALGAWSGIGLVGGLDAIEHITARLVLAWENKLPFPLRDRRLIAFLDSMCDRLILTRIGGGWIFIHRELMNFLAKEPFGKSPSEVEEALEPKGSQS